MAELLICAEDKPSVSLAEWLATGRNTESFVAQYKRGDVLVVKKDGEGWGKRESKQVWISRGFDPSGFPGDFYVVKVPGVDPAVIGRHLIRPSYRLSTDGDPDFSGPADKDMGVVTHRRGWRVDLDTGMAPAQLSALEQDGELSVVWDETRPLIVHKITGSRFNERLPEAGGPERIPGAGLKRSEKIGDRDQAAQIVELR